MAPLYLGMVLALALILVVFVRELVMELAHIPNVDAEAGLLLALSLIDLSLTGNLLFIVMFSGYENFVSKIHIADQEDRPSWMGTVDFSGIKLKLIASIVAISGIALLRAFLTLGDAGTRDTAACGQPPGGGRRHCSQQRRNIDRLTQIGKSTEAHALLANGGRVVRCDDDDGKFRAC
jgi:uncharacterized protein (TIGR00645 family)